MEEDSGDWALRIAPFWGGDNGVVRLPLSPFPYLDCIQVPRTRSPSQPYMRQPVCQTGANRLSGARGFQHVENKSVVSSSKVVDSRPSLTKRSARMGKMTESPALQGVKIRKQSLVRGLIPSVAVRQTGVGRRECAFPAASFFPGIGHPNLGQGGDIARRLINGMICAPVAARPSIALCRRTEGEFSGRGFPCEPRWATRLGPARGNRGPTRDGPPQAALAHNGLFSSLGWVSVHALEGFLCLLLRRWPRLGCSLGRRWL